MSGRLGPLAAFTLIALGLLPSVLAAPARAADPVIAAAGDIACDPGNVNFKGGVGVAGNCRQRATSDLLVGSGFDAVLALGDNQYECGGLGAYAQAYDPSWGRVKPITHPVVGNHEYLTAGGTGCDSTNAGASGYFNYFGTAAGAPGQGWYSYDLGSWHIIALNSNCGDVGGCDPSSPQGKWLAADLAAHPSDCTLAYWHIPLFSSGGRAEKNSQSFWNVLYSAGVDLILNGHDHTYERFAPQDPAANLDERTGITEFVLGTGGANHTSFATAAANSQIRDATTFGIQRITLHPGSYDWKFVPEPGGAFTDSGTRMCHGAPSDPIPAKPVFTDDFEGQDLATRWSSVAGLVAQQQEVYAGAWAARATSVSGTAAWAWEQLPQPQPALTARLRFKVLSQGANVLDLLKLRTATGGSLLTVFVAADGRLGYQNNVTTLSRYSATTAARGSWHSLEVRTAVGDTSGRVDAVLDGQSLGDLSRAESLGTTPIGRFQLGENLTGRIFDAAFDDISLETPDTTPPTTPTALTATGTTPTSVTVSWAPSTDDGKLSGYRVYLDGARVATLPGTTYTIGDLACGSTHTFGVEAVDAAGNVSPRASTTGSALACPPLALFADDFEGQDLATRWSGVAGLVAQQQEVFAGAWAARATSVSGTAAWAWEQLTQPQSTLTYRLRFKVLSQGSSVVDLLKLRTASGGALLTVFVAPDGRLGYQNNVTTLSRNSTTTAARGSWHSLEVRTAIADTAGQVAMVLDGQPVADLTRTESLGTTPIGRVQLGENLTGRTFDAAFDNVAVDAG